MGSPERAMHQSVGCSPTTENKQKFTTLTINLFMKKLIYSTALALLAAALFTNCSGQEQEAHAQTKEKRQPIFSGEVIPVKTMKISSATEEQTVTGTGLLTTENETRYAFKIGGIVEKITVREGQFFKKGQLIASLKLTEINAGFNQAKLGLQKAQRDYNRVKNLFADSVATLEQLQDSQTAVDIAQEQVDAVSFNKGYASIYADANGFVIKKLANEGEVIDAGMPVLATAQNGSDDWILKVGLSDKEWAIIPEKSLATVILDAFPDQKFEAFVFRKSLAADQLSGSFQLDIKLKNMSVVPAIGMFGKAVIKTGKQSQYTSLPHEAIIEANGKEAFVFVPEGKSKVRKLPVEIASFDAETVKIASGLENIKEVVLTNSAFLNESSVVNVQN